MTPQSLVSKHYFSLQPQVRTLIPFYHTPTQKIEKPGFSEIVCAHLPQCPIPEEPNHDQISPLTVSILWNYMNLQLLHDIMQAVTHLPLTKEAQVLSHASLYGICGEQSGTGISCFSLSISVFPRQHRYTMFHTLVISQQHNIIVANEGIIKQHEK